MTWLKGLAIVILVFALCDIILSFNQVSNNVKSINNSYDLIKMK
jgi:hypothetical protein